MVQEVLHELGQLKEPLSGMTGANQNNSSYKDLGVTMPCLS